MNLRSVFRSSLLLLAALASCGPAKPAPTPLPDGVTCSAITKVNDAAALTQALAAAPAGACVVVYRGSYAGPFTVPAGVKLIGLQGEDVQVSSDATDVAAITLTGAEGSGLFSIKVVGGKASGVEVKGGPATVNGLTVSTTERAGLLVSCPAGADCAAPVTITDATLEDSGIGLQVAGARAQVTGGSVRRSIARVLAGGYGVAVSAGGHLDASGLTIEQCEAAGLIVDGASQRTTARLSHVTARGNKGPGVVGQGLAGTLADPWLVIESSTLEANRGRGLSLSGSRGVIVSDTAVRDTVSVPVTVSMGGVENVGDGVVIRNGSGDVRIERSTLEANPRCQALIDDGRAGISIVDSQVALGGGQYLVVVQASVAVDVPAAQVSAPTSSLSP
jgi:hypothetical protein